MQPRVMKAKLLEEYIGNVKFRNNEVAIIGSTGSSGKTFRILFGKKGLQIPSIFFKQFFKKDSDITPAMNGIFIPILITDKKHLSKEVLEILKTNKSVIVETGRGDLNR